MHLPELAYEPWAPTRWTLHLYCQVVGKIRLATTPYLNHWWNVTLRLTDRGLTTGRMLAGATAFRIELDLVAHAAIVESPRGRDAFALHDGLSVAEFYAALFGLLRAHGVEVRIWPRSYGIPTIDVRLDEDRTHASYDAAAVERFWTALSFSADVFARYASGFTGKASPVQLFWHSFDLATARFSGREAPPREGANLVERRAYSHEVISCGFWPGDEATRFPAYYTYTAPQPPGLEAVPLHGGSWVPLPSGTHLGVLPYDDVRNAADPGDALLAFLRSAYDAGARTARWPETLLAV